MPTSSWITKRPLFVPNDLVVYRRRKRGAHPGRRAKDIRPAPFGDDYDYVVSKYWVVSEVSDDGRITVRTPGGKLHDLRIDDPNLHRLSWHDRLRLAIWDRTRLRALRQRSA